MDGYLVINRESKAKIELRSRVDSRTSEEAVVIASLRGRLAKQMEGSQRWRRAWPDYSQSDVEQSYSPSFEKFFALSWIAFIAILGPFHPMISSFLSSSSSVAMKNFSSSC
jgi:hypothetical protein